MPAPIFATLLVSVVAAAGLTTALILAWGLSPVWLGLVAVSAAIAVRALKW